MLRAVNDPEAEVIMDVAGQEAEEDHDGFPEDTGIGNVYQFNTKKRGYSQVKDLFNEILMDVGENPSLLKEAFERCYEHVAKPIFKKIALLNAADNGVGNGVGGIRSLSSVNEGLPPRSERYKPAWESVLESHGSQRGKRRDTSERELKKKSLKHKDPFVLSPSTSVNQQRVPKLIADKNTVKTVSDRSLSDRLQQQLSPRCLLMVTPRRPSCVIRRQVQFPAISMTGSRTHLAHTRSVELHLLSCKVNVVFFSSILMLPS